MSTQLYLFANIAGTAIAIPTSELEAVVHLGEIEPIARTASHVRGLAALRSRVLTVIDVRARITGEITPIAHAPLAIVAEVEGHAYGLMIDGVTDICAVEGDVERVRGRISPIWESYAQGMLIHEGKLHLAVSIADFIRIQPTAAAA